MNCKKKGLNGYSRLLLNGLILVTCSFLICTITVNTALCALDMDRCVIDADSSYWSGPWGGQGGAECQEACIYYAYEEAAVAAKDANALAQSISYVATICDIWKQYVNNGMTAGSTCKVCSWAPLTMNSSGSSSSSDTDSSSGCFINSVMN